LKIIKAEFVFGIQLETKNFRRYYDTDNVIAENFQCKDNQSPLVESGNTVGGERECSNF